MHEMNNFYRLVGSVIGILLLWALLSARLSAMEGNPSSLLEMVIDAELIVTGEVLEIRKQTFLLKPAHVVRGRPQETFEIEKARMVCSPRRFEYAVGQKLFVMAMNDEQGKLRVVGRRCEGESLLAGDDVICSFSIADHRAEFFSHPRPNKVPLRDLQNALADFPKVYQASTSKHWAALLPNLRLPPARLLVYPRVSKAAVKKYAQQSWVHKLLSQQVKAANE